MKPWPLLILLLALPSWAPAAPPAPAGEIVTHVLDSEALRANCIGLDSRRAIQVYQPAGYNTDDTGAQSLPVVYFIPAGNLDLGQSGLAALLDDAIAQGRLPPLLLVTGDFTTPNTINFFGNNPVTGRWLDFVRTDLVGFIDGHYRTLARAQSRAVVGHFLGGYAAIKLAMLYPDTFGAVYGLHPVATDTGERSMLWVPDWQEIHRAKSYEDLKAPYSNAFVSMAQAHLPNPDRPPFFADFLVEATAEGLRPMPLQMQRLRRSFLLADLLPDHPQSLNHIAYDWGRNDANPAHVYSARKFTVALEDFGLRPQAVEHGGNGWDYDYTATGRVSLLLLPFLASTLVVD